MPWLNVRTAMCCMLLVLLSMSTSCRAPWNSEDVTLDDAEFLAALEAQRLGYDTGAMKQECDEDNRSWTEFVTAQESGGSKYPDASLRDRLTSEDYWAVYFGPMSETTAGGDIWLFISRSSGACLGVIRGK